MFHKAILLLPFFNLSLTHAISSSSSDDSCADNLYWFDKKRGRDCGVVSVDPEINCHWADRNGITAHDACPSSCDSACVPEVSARVYSSASNLRVSSNIVKIAASSSGSGSDSLSDSSGDDCIEGLNCTTSTSADRNCTDNADWFDKKRGRDCDAVFVDPEINCHWADRNGISAHEACPSSCDRACVPEVSARVDPSASNLRVSTNMVVDSLAMVENAFDCTDSLLWYDKKRGLGCDFVAENPEINCHWSDSNGKSAYEACKGVCDSNCSKEAQ